MASIVNPSLGVPTRFPYGFPKNPVNAKGIADDLPVADADVFVTGAAIDEMTLPAPVAGVYENGTPLEMENDLGVPNDDGKVLLVYSTGAYAHTITTPANAINGSEHIATFGGAVGDYIRLIAFDGVWYVLDSNGVTLS